MQDQAVVGQREAAGLRLWIELLLQDLHHGLEKLESVFGLVQIVERNGEVHARRQLSLTELSEDRGRSLDDLAQGLLRQTPGPQLCLGNALAQDQG